MSIPVAIARIQEYESTLLDSATALVLEESGFRPGPGTEVLVKPNLVSSSNARHCCTNPLLVRAACAYLLDCGARVSVADSPGYGPAAHVARRSGLKEALAGLGLGVTSLRRPVPVRLSGGVTMGISRQALEAERILNIPKLKVHCQMVMSGAVKNLFGCVVGFRKAVAHNRLGHDPLAFRAMIMDVYAALPQAHHLMDGVHPLHKDGPVNGEPYPLELLAACENGVALDTATYAILGLKPGDVPLWAEAHLRHMAGATPDELAYPLEQPGQFRADGFQLSVVRPLDFHVMRILKGRFRSLLKHFQKR
ncbi:DUF362 domain-containing protein [Pseudodesulfovibrio cashew]|uniref:DUF362 domain-containing protein n=1 Tax=Pseudodesulfovibrio cashew TaxID=2678688 RepID=A0A6I6JM23_9BACT|nr:DUF362 domain-containing protein [Pseudodesulfovibrio cashew]QGY38734.1 DUF362 domain-containing protein [Pseudodesulfovibrio cashew]